VDRQFRWGTEWAGRGAVAEIAAHDTDTCTKQLSIDCSAVLVLHCCQRTSLLMLRKLKAPSFGQPNCFFFWIQKRAPHCTHSGSS